MSIKGRILEHISTTGRKITISQIEKALNLSNGTINHWDDHNPTLQNLIKVSDYLGCSIDYLLERESIYQNQTINFSDFLNINRNRYQLSETQEQALYSVVNTYLNAKDRM